jgi:hypothetical protein
MLLTHVYDRDAIIEEREDGGVFHQLSYLLQRIPEEGSGAYSRIIYQTRKAGEIVITVLHEPKDRSTREAAHSRKDPKAVGSGNIRWTFLIISNSMPISS